MTQPRARRFRLPPTLLGAGLVSLACLVATTGRAQRPAFEPAPAAELPEAERARRLSEGGRYGQDADTLLQAGKVDEAAQALGKKIALQREVLGGLHEGSPWPPCPGGGPGRT